jgi:glyoxylase-like metal-dependent hydrolase (beta-lactamase superfamily II)
MKVYRFTDAMMGSNIYLIPEHGIIIDTGTGYSAWEILNQMRERAPLKGIKEIALTHMHFDHSGGAESFVKATGARVFISDKDGEPLKKRDRETAGYTSPLSPMPEVELAPLKEGDTIGPLKVIESPGHTAGSICLYEPKEKLLFTGDTVFADGVGRYDLPTGSRAELKRSLGKLSDVEIRIIYPGHGDTIGGDPDDVSTFLRELAGIV